MDISFMLNILITFLSNHQILAYFILFFSSLFETIIGFSFFIYGEIFFLAGAILAGMGILNIWLVVIVLYVGGLLGDSTSYFLGRKYGFSLYQYLEGKGFFKKYINKNNYEKGFRFFKKYGGKSVFFARFLGPVSWITPFLAGIHKLDYKIFLKYDFPAVILGIGQFIVVGYIAGIHYKTLLNLFFRYSFILLFVGITLIYLYIYLKKSGYISKFKRKWLFSKKKLLLITIKHFILIITTITIIFLVFLFYLSFGYSGVNYPQNTHTNQTILLNNAYLNNCENLNTYYFDSNSTAIQPINVIFITNETISKILDGNWIKINIFKDNKFSFWNYIMSIKNQNLPVSNLYMRNLSQNTAYQYGRSSIIEREHIRFWSFVDESNLNQRIYLGSISDDDGFTVGFYNYFLTPLHEINQNVDKSRDLLYYYLLTKQGINCKYIQTNCKVKKLRHDDDQRYYTDGKILLCIAK